MENDKTCSVHEKMKRHKSLTVRIAIYFIAFGLVIGYFSYIFTTILRTHRLMHEQRNWALKEFHQNFIRNHPDEFNLADFILSNRADVADFINAINQPAVKESAWMLTRDTRLRFFFYTAEASTWRLLSSADGNRLTILPVPDDIKNHLEKSKGQKIVSQSPLFWGQAETIIFFFRIYRDSQGNIFVLRVEDSREGILADLHRNVTQVFMFSVVLLLVSLLLGKLFARRVVRPVQALTEGAEAIAGGDYTRRFDMNRDDEIGRLALSLNNMAHRFEDYITQLKSRLDTLETMNLIDKAILSSLSRDQLLYRVIDIVSTLFRASDVMLMLRDHQRGGYEILYAGDSDTPANNFPAALMTGTNPEKVALSRFRSDTELGEEITSRLKEFTHYEFSESPENFSEKEGLKQRLQAYFAEELFAMMSIPLEFDDNFYGAVLIARHKTEAWSEEQIRSGRMLAEEEYDIIKTHPVRGMEIVQDITSYREIIPGIYSHHEHWDGSGYPQGLSGEAIPLSARIITVADVYDAITDDRPYRKGMNAEDAVIFMRKQSSRLFDPELVTLFIHVLREGTKYDSQTLN